MGKNIPLLKVHTNRWTLTVEMCGDVWRCVEMCGDVWRCVEMCGGCVEMCGDVWRCVGMCGLLGEDMWRHEEGKCTKNHFAHVYTIK